jgi:excisionase family DNA binding protein
MQQHDTVPESLACSLSEGARIVGVGLSTFKEIAKSGHIATFTIGRRRLVPIAELQRFIAERMALAAK